MGRNIGAGVAGVIIAGLLVWCVETIGHLVYPMPEGLDYTDMDAMGAYIAALPVGAFLFVVAAWAVGSLVGTMVASRLGTAPAYIFAVLVGGFVLLGIGISVAAFPHPTWMAVAGVVGTIAAAWLGAKQGGTRPATE